MKGGLHTKLAGGFTIVETLIVLAVTGVIFLSAAALISGKEAKAEFTQSVQSIRGQLQQTINEVQTGFYSNPGNFSCTAPAGGPYTWNAGGPVSGQGANAGCIFLGKAIYFPHNSNPNNAQPFYTYTMVGLQRDSAGNEVKTLKAAKPVVLKTGEEDPYELVPNAYTTQTLKFGLAPVSVKASGTALLGFAFVSGLGQYDSANVRLLSGSQQVNLLPITGIPAGGPSGSASGDADRIDNYLRSVNLSASDDTTSIFYNPAGGVNICFKSGTTNQSALITIGNGTTQLVVTLAIKSSNDCT
jgi:type II secretory pathway pseudopilin PulG